MELAVISIGKIATMFIIGLIGLMCYRIGLINEDTKERLSQILLFLITPLVIFTSYQQKFDASMLKGLLIAIGLAAFTHVIGILLTYIMIRKDPERDYQIERLSAIYSNCGFIGIPIAQGMFGAEGVFYTTAYITVFNVLLWTHGIMTVTGKKDLRSCLYALGSPSIIAVLIGFLCYLLHLVLPQVLLEPLVSLAGMNTPLAMLIAGVSIGSSNIIKMLKKKRIYYVCFLRLILIPLVVMMALKLIPVDDVIRYTVLLGAACPVGASATLFAISYHKDSIYASEIFGVSTVLSIVTIPFIMLICGTI